MFLFVFWGNQSSRIDTVIGETGELFGNMEPTAGLEPATC